MEDAAPPLPRRSVPKILVSSLNGLGGGFTSRSSGEKGTPREPQRLALGERPRDTDTQRTAPSSHSPQQTSRSGGLSSDQWPRSPSSQGDGLSSRKSSESLSYNHEDSFMFNIAGASNGGDARSRQPEGRDQEPHYQLDLSKSLEVMRFVIMKENKKLRERMQQTQEYISDLHLELEDPGPASVQIEDNAFAVSDTAASEHSEPLGTTEPHSVEWRIEHLDAIRTAPAAHREVSSFKLPAFPDVDFSLVFYPRATCECDAAPSCELSIDAISISGSHNELRVKLSLDFEYGKDSSFVFSEDASDVSEALLSGREAGARASCSVRRVWPPSPSQETQEDSSKWTEDVVAVIGRIEVQELSSGAGKLCVQSVTKSDASVSTTLSTP
eukprot:TRINITY_DN20541_c0_g1_i1.p1 TRINITY_DN20541_c0_g1~~TRINITY_DN20541_c0_g1_i1.p1  ORF type:complete len:384 (+),score=50.24 TRINITY_DN20541_c0_g1_i1:63-1214(+)